MKNKNNVPFYKIWVKPNRVISIFIGLGSIIILILNALSILQFTTFEQIVIGLLALLSIDGLIERITALDKIQEKLQDIPESKYFHQKIDIPKIEVQTANAHEIIIIAVSAVTLITNYAHYFEEKLKQGCKFKIVLLNPDGPSMQSWILLNKLPCAEADIRQSLEQLRRHAQLGKESGIFEIRLLDVFLPYSMFAVDLDSKRNGSMVIEFHGYKLGSRERPHVYLTYQNSPEWYNKFHDQFTHVWSEAKPWSP